jgi:hypothetical protein
MLEETLSAVSTTFGILLSYIQIVISAVKLINKLLERKTNAAKDALSKKLEKNVALLEHLKSIRDVDKGWFSDDCLRKLTISRTILMTP